MSVIKLVEISRPLSCHQ